MASELLYVPVKFPREVVGALDALAKADRSLWYDHGGVIGEQPSRSAAVKQLVAEALEARGVVVGGPVAE